MTTKASTELSFSAAKMAEWKASNSDFEMSGTMRQFSDPPPLSASVKASLKEMA